MTVKQHTTKRDNRLKVPTSLLLYRWLIYSSAKASTQLAAALAYKLWFSSPKYAESDREKHWRVNSEQFRVAHPICQIPVYRWGNKGPKVLLVHGWSGRGPQLGAIATALADAGFQAYAFDAPGHGRSVGRSTTIFEFEDVIQSLNREIGPFYSVVAHSFGVLVSALAIRNGLRVNSLISISSPASMEHLFERYCSMMRLPENVSEAVRKKFLARFGNDLWERVSVISNLAQLALPVLVLHDKDDLDVPWRLSKDMCDALPHATLSLSQGLGHRRILRHPDAIKRTLDFIQNGKLAAD